VSRGGGRFQPVGLLVVLVVLCSALAACGVPTDRSPKTIDSARVPFDLVSPTTTSRTAPTGLSSTDVFYVSGARLIAIPRHVPGAVTADSALKVLAAGPTGEELDRGVKTLLPAGGVLRASLSGGQASVQLAESFGGLSGQDEILAVAEVVYTLTALPEVGSVAFTLADAPVEVPLEDGTLSAGPLTRAAYAGLAPP
jgi:hypothetical protein